MNLYITNKYLFSFGKHILTSQHFLGQTQLKGDVRRCKTNYSLVKIITTEKQISKYKLSWVKLFLMKPLYTNMLVHAMEHTTGWHTKHPPKPNLWIL